MFHTAAAFALWATASLGLSDATLSVPKAFAVSVPASAAPRGVSDLKFQDIFQRPVGPAGLALTDTVRALDGKRVRMVGYMVKGAASSPGLFLLSPLPVMAGEEDEGLADDVPATTVAVVLPNAVDVPYFAGLIQVTGTLRLAPREDARSSRILNLSLELDEKLARQLTRLARRHPPSPSTHAHP
ncbi:hypothetical protein [Tahibacter amnicola]|uniref:Uncharacterized protein n=1 Tax=Tahibacter amnicola TaxID=2976241 RepID=A0ABY6BFA3_9GAMM|nr:hypothetical protein [Tahibacter amnicola]UXI68197.1 hypothetical protein N4264_00655 [Tahibacter amnicola]